MKPGTELMRIKNDLLPMCKHDYLYLKVVVPHFTNYQMRKTPENPITMHTEKRRKSDAL